MATENRQDLQFKVGEAFPLPPAQAEGAFFSVEPYTMILIYYFNQPTAEEITEFNTGKFSLALTEAADVLFVLSRFGRMAWCDAPYSAALASSNRVLPEIGEKGTGYAIDAFMVDLSNNVLKAHRLVRMDLDFSSAFKKAFEVNKSISMTEIAYQKAVAKVYQSFSVQDLLRGAKVKMI